MCIRDRYIRCQNPIPSYSKAPWGLSVLLQVTGIFTGNTVSPRCVKETGLMMNKNKIIKTARPITCTGISRIPNKKVLDINKFLLHM